MSRKNKISEAKKVKFETQCSNSFMLGMQKYLTKGPKSKMLRTTHHGNDVKRAGGSEVPNDGKLTSLNHLQNKKKYNFLNIN